MQEWLKKICEYIMLYIAGPAAATIVAYLFERRKEKRDMAPLLQMIIFDSKEKLRLNQEEVKKNKRIIQISIRRSPETEENRRIGQNIISFCEINFNRLENEVKHRKVFYIGFYKFYEDPFSLEYVEYEGAFYSVDNKVVPAHNDNAERFCFVCNLEDAPDAFLGWLGERNVRYKISKKDNSVRPELMKERLYVCRNSARI